MIPFPRKLANHLALGCLITAAASPMAFAQAGQLDATFATKGIFSNNFRGVGGAAAAVALESDGKIIAAGQTGNANSTGSRGLVLRLNSSGTLDTTFGSAGVVMIRFAAIQDVLTGMAIQTDGKIVVAGTGIGGGSGQLVRLNTDGSFDTTFGSDGFVPLFPATPGALALESDGKILLELANLNQLQRYNSNGTLDTAFGTDGTTALVAGGTIALQPSGKFLVSPGGLTSGSLARYNPNGGLDTTFGVSGQGAALAAPALTLQSDGKVVTGGSIVSEVALTGNTSGFGLTRFNANGTLDATFGSRASVVTEFPGFVSASTNALAVQADGDIVAAGGANNGGNAPTGPFALARYLSTGQLDATFGTAGLVTTSFGGSGALISAVTIQTDGKIVVAGTDGAGDFVVARYLGQ